jgi:hypothetical protein
VPNQKLQNNAESPPSLQQRTQHPKQLATWAFTSAPLRGIRSLGHTTTVQCSVSTTSMSPRHRRYQQNETQKGRRLVMTAVGAGIGIPLHPFSLASPSNALGGAVAWTPSQREYGARVGKSKVNSNTRYSAPLLVRTSRRCTLSLSLSLPFPVHDPLSFPLFFIHSSVDSTSDVPGVPRRGWGLRKVV